MNMYWSSQVCRLDQELKYIDCITVYQCKDPQMYRSMILAEVTEYH